MARKVSENQPWSFFSPATTGRRSARKELQNRLAAKAGLSTDTFAFWVQRAKTSFRADLVKAARQGIARGLYDDPRKLEAAVAEAVRDC